MLKIIEHPNVFKTGTRVLNLLSRNKDQANKRRTIIRTTHTPEQFDRQLKELLSIADEGQRLYASAEARDVEKAIRSFKLAQLDADYDPDPKKFYRSLESRWASALMKPTNGEKANRLWLLDCDNVDDYTSAARELDAHYDRDFRYEYETKSGRHILIKPFNATLSDAAFQNLIHKNPMMLWAY